MSFLDRIKNHFNKEFGTTAVVTTQKLDIILFDKLEIKRQMVNGQVESIKWEEINEIKIITTDEGPFVDDVFWVMIGENTGCIAPSESIGINELIEEFQKLPGFNNAEVIKAMTSIKNNSFTCWRRN